MERRWVIISIAAVILLAGTVVLSVTAGGRGFLNEMVPAEGPDPAGAGGDRAVDPLGGGWKSSTEIPGGLYHYAAAQCLEDGSSSFYVVGGINDLLQRSNKLFRFDYLGGAGSWTELAPIPDPLEGGAATCWRGYLFVAGGVGVENHPTKKFWIYDIHNDQWDSGPKLRKKVWGAGLGAWGKKIYLVGGENLVDGPSRRVYRWKIGSRKWRRMRRRMARQAVMAGWAQRGRFLYGVGGWNKDSPAENSTSTLRYNMAANKWDLGPEYTFGRADLALATTADRLWAMGGDAPGGGFFDSSNTFASLDLREWSLGGTWQLRTNHLLNSLQGFRGNFCTNRAAGAGRIWTVGGGYGGPTPVIDASANYIIRKGRCARMIFNSSFETGNGEAKGWVGTNLDPGDGRSSARSRWGGWSFRVQGMQADKRFSQFVEYSGLAGDRIDVSGWGRNIGTRAKGGPIRLRLKVTYQDDSEENYNLDFPRESGSWKYRYDSYKISADYKFLQLDGQVKDQKGEVFMDGLNLLVNF